MARWLSRGCGVSPEGGDACSCGPRRVAWVGRTRGVADVGRAIPPDRGKFDPPQPPRAWMGRFQSARSGKFNLPQPPRASKPQGRPRRVAGAVSPTSPKAPPVYTTKQNYLEMRPTLRNPRPGAYSPLRCRSAATRLWGEGWLWWVSFTSLVPKNSVAASTISSPVCPCALAKS